MLPPPTFEIPVHDSKGTAGDEDDEPEPENEENLLVHNVQREKAHGVKFVNLSDGAVGEEVTLGHLGEDLMHWVNPIQLLTLKAVM